MRSESSYRYPDNLHPDVIVPPAPPAGWPRLAVLYSRRLAAGVTRPELAAAAERSVDTLRAWERGFVSVTPARLDVYEGGLLRALERRRDVGAAELSTLPPASQARAATLLAELAELVPQNEVPGRWVARVATSL